MGRVTSFAPPKGIRRQKCHRVLLFEDSPFANTQVHPKGPGVDFPAFFLGCPSAVADHALTCWMALKRGPLLPGGRWQGYNPWTTYLTAPLYEVPIFGDSLFGKETQNTGGDIPFIVSLIVFAFPANRSLKGYPLGATGYGRAGRQ